MFHLLIVVITTSMLTTTVYGASQRPTISTVQVGQLEAEYRKATNQIDKTRILNTLRESGFAHIAHELAQKNIPQLINTSPSIDTSDIVIEPRKPAVITKESSQTQQRVKRPVTPVANTGYEIEDGAASLQALFSEEPEVIQLSPEQQKALTYQGQQKVEQQQEKELAYQRQRAIEQQRHKEEQQKEAALKAAHKEQEQKNMFQQLLASLTKDVNKEGRNTQQMGITMQWINKHIGEITRSDLAQEDKERILGEFNGIKEQLAQKIAAATAVKQ